MPTVNVSEILYVAFKAQVIALDRKTGDRIWEWRASKGHGFVALLLDGDRLFVSVLGYTYCLDPLSGQQLWFNPMEGYGYGIPMLLTARGTTQVNSAAAAEDQAQEEL